MTGSSALPGGEETLHRCRAAVLAAMEAPNVDAGWGDALAALQVDASSVCRADLPTLLAAMHVAASLAVLVARRELLLIADGPEGEHEQHDHGEHEHHELAEPGGGT